MVPSLPGLDRGKLFYKGTERVALIPNLFMEVL